LITFWFTVVVLAWVLFFVLEGFDFGVGLLGPLLGRGDHERGAAVRTIGPFWDGNEVWLVAAIGATFAAFPLWYAALLSGLYLPVAAVLLLLAVRGVALEFRGKGDGLRWRRRADVLLAASSAAVVAVWGPYSPGPASSARWPRCSRRPCSAPPSSACGPAARSVAGPARWHDGWAPAARSPWRSSVSVRDPAPFSPLLRSASRPACWPAAGGRPWPSPRPPLGSPAPWSPSSPPTATWSCVAP
jgi:hypothetical protein